MPIDLSLASIDDLFTELESRCDDIVIVMRRVLDKDEQTHSYKYLHPAYDKLPTTIFLLRHCEHKLLTAFEETGEKAEPWQQL